MNNEEYQKCRFIGCNNDRNRYALAPYDTMCSACYDEYKLIIAEEKKWRMKWNKW